MDFPAGGEAFGSGGARRWTDQADPSDCADLDDAVRSSLRDGRCDSPVLQHFSNRLRVIALVREDDIGPFTGPATASGDGGDRVDQIAQATSLTVAPVVTTTSGTPFRSQATWCSDPGPRRLDRVKAPHLSLDSLNRMCPASIQEPSTSRAYRRRSTPPTGVDATCRTPPRRSNVSNAASTSSPSRTPDPVVDPPTRCS